MWKVVSGFVAGILTLWIVPQLTRQVQDRAAERNVKSEIAREMSTAHTDLSAVAIFRTFDLVQRRSVDAVNFNPNGTIRRPLQASALPPKAFNNAFVLWRKRINQIETRLAIEFPDDTELADAYRKAMLAENRWFFVSQAPQKPTHVPDLERSLKSLDETVHDNYDWEEGTLALRPAAVDALAKGQVSKDSIGAFYDAYADVSDDIGDALNAVIQQMYNTQAEGLSTTSCDLFRTIVTMPPGACF